MLSRRKFLSLVASTAVSTVALSACGTQATPTPKAAALPAEINMTCWVQANQIEEYRAKNIVSGAEAVSKELGKTTIKMEATPDSAGWADYAKKCLLAFEGKTAPDIICTGHEYIAAYSDNGYILALDDLIKKYSSTYDDIIPSLWNSCSYKGKRWAIPQDCEARPLFWSKPALKKIGWSDADIAALPEKIKKGEFTLQDVLETAKMEQDKGAVEKGSAFWTRWGAGNDWYSFYYSFGGETQDTATGKLIFVKDAWTKHYQFFYDVFNTYGICRKDIIGSSSSKVIYPGVASATVGFYFGGTWQWSDWAKNYIADKGGEPFLFDNIGYGLIPASTKGGKPATVTHPLIYIVNAASKYPEIAFRCVTGATTPELNTLHAVGSTHLAILKKQSEVAAYKASKFLQDCTYMLEYSRFIPNHPKFSVYDGAAWKALTGVASGEFKPDAAVKLVEDELKAQLASDVIFK